MPVDPPGAGPLAPALSDSRPLDASPPEAAEPPSSDDGASPWLDAASAFGDRLGQHASAAATTFVNALGRDVEITRTGPLRWHVRNDPIAHDRQIDALKTIGLAAWESLRFAVTARSPIAAIAQMSIDKAEGCEPAPPVAVQTWRTMQAHGASVAESIGATAADATLEASMLFFAARGVSQAGGAVPGTFVRPTVSFSVRQVRPHTPVAALPAGVRPPLRLGAGDAVARAGRPARRLGESAPASRPSTPAVVDTSGIETMRIETPATRRLAGSGADMRGSPMFSTRPPASTLPPRTVDASARPWFETPAVEIEVDTPPVVQRAFNEAQRALSRPTESAMQTLHRPRPATAAPPVASDATPAAWQAAGAAARAVPVRIESPMQRLRGALARIEPSSRGGSGENRAQAERLVKALKIAGVRPNTVIAPLHVLARDMAVRPLVAAKVLRLLTDAGAGFDDLGRDGLRFTRWPDRPVQAKTLFPGIANFPRTSPRLPGGALDRPACLLELNAAYRRPFPGNRLPPGAQIAVWMGITHSELKSLNVTLTRISGLWIDGSELRRAPRELTPADLPVRAEPVAAAPAAPVPSGIEHFLRPRRLANGWLDHTAALLQLNRAYRLPFPANRLPPAAQIAAKMGITRQELRFLHRTLAELSGLRIAGNELVAPPRALTPEDIPAATIQRAAHPRTSAMPALAGLRNFPRLIPYRRRDVGIMLLRLNRAYRLPFPDHRLPPASQIAARMGMTRSEFAALNRALTELTGLRIADGVLEAVPRHLTPSRVDAWLAQQRVR